MTEPVSNAIASAKIAWDSTTEPYPISRLSRRGPETEHFRKLGDCIAWLEWGEWCIIKKIETLNPRTGACTRLLEFLKSIADQHGVRITGNPVYYEPTCQLAAASPLAQDQLEAWYSSHGFLVRKDDNGYPHLWYPNAPGV